MPFVRTDLAATIRALDDDGRQDLDHTALRDATDGRQRFLDAYPYMTRGGVFANVQTGNVILYAIGLSQGHSGKTLGHLWPIFAFLGVLQRFSRSPGVLFILDERKGK